MVPMILAWCLVVGVLFILLFAYHEEAVWSVMERVVAAVASLPFIGERFVEWMESNVEDGVFAPDVGAIDFKAAALKVWGLISLAFMILGGLLGRWLGPFKPWSLKRKLGVAAAASSVIVIAFTVLYFTDRESFGSPLGPVLLSSGGFALILFLISSWSLTLSHALGWVSQVIMNAEIGATGPRDRLA